MLESDEAGRGKGGAWRKGSDKISMRQQSTGNKGLNGNLPRHIVKRRYL